MLDPVEYTSRAPFQYVSATLPAAFLSGLAFWLVTKLIVQPAGKGGYDEGELPAPTRSSTPPVPETLLQATER